jgi:hypothetical protein
MRRLTAITLLLAAAIAGCSGPSPLSALLPQASPTATPTATPSPKLATDPAEIMGTWQGTFAGNPGFLIFGEAGHLIVSQSQDGSLGAVGQYFFEGTRLALRTDLPFPGCDLGSTAYYEARLEQQDGVTAALRFTLMDDPCVERMTSLVTETAAWVRP